MVIIAENHVMSSIANNLKKGGKEMKKFIILLVTAAAVVSIMFAGCMPGAPEVPPPPVTPPPAPEVEKFPPGGNLPINPFGADFAVKPDGTSYRFVNSPIYLGCDWEVNADGLCRNLVERAGGHYQLLDPDLDVMRQVNGIEDLITAGYIDGMFIQPVEEGMVVPMCEKAMEAGIAIIGFTAMVPGEPGVSHVSNTGHKFDGPTGVKCIADYFIDIAESENRQINIFEVWGMRAMPTSRERHDGIWMYAEPHESITILESADSNWTDSIATDLVIDAFTANPELNALYVHGGGCTGAVEGLRQLGLLTTPDDPNHVIVGTCDPDYVISDAMDAGYIDAVGTHDSRASIDISVKNMFHYVVLGQPIPPKVIIPLKLIRRDTMDTETLFGDIALYTRMPIVLWNLWPPLDTTLPGLTSGPPDYEPLIVETPTLEMRMQLMGY